MDISQVPQEGNKTLGGQRKAMYAKDADGRIVNIASKGWEAKEIVTSAAVEQLQELTSRTHARALSGEATSIEYWMYAKRMDIAILSQTTGIWQWRIRRHFRPTIFAQLSDKTLSRYAEALGLTLAQLKTLPQ